MKKNNFYYLLILLLSVLSPTYSSCNENENQQAVLSPSTNVSPSTEEELENLFESDLLEELSEEDRMLLAELENDINTELENTPNPPDLPEEGLSLTTREKLSIAYHLIKLHISKHKLAYGIGTIAAIVTAVTAGILLYPRKNTESESSPPNNVRTNLEKEFLEFYNSTNLGHDERQDLMDKFFNTEDQRAFLDNLKTGD